MEVVNGKVILTEDEINWCPIDTKWAARMVQIYGPDTGSRGRLSKLSRCPEVLKQAGYEVIIAGSEEEERAIAEKLMAEKAG